MSLSPPEHPASPEPAAESLPAAVPEKALSLPVSQPAPLSAERTWCSPTETSAVVTPDRAEGEQHEQ